jgi:hypothetical protein
MAQTTDLTAAQVCAALSSDLEFNASQIKNHSGALRALATLARPAEQPQQGLPLLGRDDLAALFDLLSSNAAGLACEAEDHIAAARRLIA